MKATYHKYILNFKRPSGTSRGILKKKETWFIILTDGKKIGIGECGILRGLSIDDRPDYEEKLQEICFDIHLGLEKLLKITEEFPSIQFGLEQAFLSLQSKNSFELFASSFTKGDASIKINGLIWMGDPDFMKAQIQQKLDEGYDCIKMKIGAISFEEEIKLLALIRKDFSKDQIEIRVDANGAFSPQEAMSKLNILAQYDLHSIEQPIKQGQLIEMKQLCEMTPLPIALDEELIGIFNVTNKEEILQIVKPQFIILKPSLVGGFKGTDEWIELAEKYAIKWWITSALESNIGLNAIAQYAYLKGVTLPQGLGTGSLYTNNFECPLKVSSGYLSYEKDKKWNVNII
ncbi:o-succinylbenzoate synthase [Ascidiimonas sp. W6]|uniref:o-succinylbenzoate synthase n=1 Tax=Ascidiimonas meishanensis TaxID=3128903 RepID=UPI0030EF8866